MLETIWTEYLLEQLSDQLRSFDPPPAEYLPLPDKWLALSLLQKAIRRGDKPQAIRAAYYLFHFDYHTLWRRLVVIGWEDIGVGNADLSFAVTAAAGSKRWRQAHGGDWHCAQYLTIAMCGAIKDRTIDDMIEVAQYGLDFEKQREEFCEQPFEHLRDIAYNQQNGLAVRMIAAWYMCGTDRYGFEGLRRRKGDMGRYFHSSAPHLCGEHVSNICKIGVSRSSTILPVFLPLFWKTYVEGDHGEFTEDEGLTTQYLQGVPRYAYDGFTRAGSRHLKKISREQDQLRAFLNEAAPKSEHNALIRNMYFRIESALCDKRLDWPVGLNAHELAGQVGYGLDAHTYMEGMRLLRLASLQIPMTEADL